LQRASYQRRKLAGRIPVKGSSFWATPTFKSGGNRACLKLSPLGIAFMKDLNQTGSQIGLRQQAVSWSLFWELADAMGWKGNVFPTSHPHRVILLNGVKHLSDALSLNPAFTDWIMGWPMGWTAPQRPVTEWSHWLRHMRSELSKLSC
jgi:hypothetical protein